MSPRGPQGRRGQPGGVRVSSQLHAPSSTTPLFCSRWKDTLASGGKGWWAQAFQAWAWGKFGVLGPRWKATWGRQLSRELEQRPRGDQLTQGSGSGLGPADTQAALAGEGLWWEGGVLAFDLHSGVRDGVSTSTHQSCFHMELKVAGDPQPACPH